MYMLIRMPLACLLILLYTFIYYRSKRRLRTRTSRAFEWMAVLGIVHLVAAVVTEYTVNNRDKVPAVFNHVWHIIFLVSITCVCALLYYYLLLYVERGTGVSQRVSKRALLCVAAVGILGELVLPITYVDTPYGSYSLGMKAYALYIVVVFVLVMMIVKLIRCRMVVGKEKSNVLLASVGIFIVVSVIQMAYPHMLLTSLALTMIVLGIMVNTEDVHMYISCRTNLYNEQGCREIIRELLFKGEAFKIAVYVFLGENAEIEQGMLSVQKQLPEKKLHVICGMLADNILAVIPLIGFGGVRELPAQLPAPDCRLGKLKYTTELLSYDGTESISFVLDSIWNFKERFEEDALQRDELTGLLRRAAFIRQVEYLICTGQEFTFLMIDLDDFKAINDTYGHDKGDRVLKGVADVLKQNLRGTDILCRIGGDEFAVALFGITDEREVFEIAERIRRSLLNTKDSDQDMFAVGFSVGAKAYRRTDRAVTFQELYTETDAALYDAKFNGKNRLSFAKASTGAAKE